MRSTSRVSAIIPFYGDPRQTLPLVDSLVAEGLHEIIVVDDHSPHPFPKRENLTVVRRAQNGGFGAAVNTGAAVATGEFLLVLNSDLSIRPDFVEKLVAAAEDWQPAVVSPAVVEGGTLASTGRRWPTVSSTAISWLTPLARVRHTSLWRGLVGHVDSASMPARGQRVDWVVGACMLLPAADFKDIGGFDERFYMNSEEVDLQRRLCGRGVLAAVVPSVQVNHVGGGSSDPLMRRQWLIDGLFIYFTKWSSSGSLAALLVVASAANWAWNLTRRLRGVPVDPKKVLREELGLIAHGFAHRFGSQGSG